jgi:hypothetical protein
MLENTPFSIAREVCRFTFLLRFGSFSANAKRNSRRRRPGGLIDWFRPSLDLISAVSGCSFTRFYGFSYCIAGENH